MKYLQHSDIESLTVLSTGETWSAWGRERCIPLADITAFADLSDNHQWIHEDGERSRTESPYGYVIVHGLLLVALIPSLLPSEGFDPYPIS